MTSAIAENHQFHETFKAATQQLHLGRLDAALGLLRRAQKHALAVAGDALLGANAQQNYVTSSLIVMGIQFRQQHHADTLSTYHELFHQLDHWLAQQTQHAAQHRLRGFQTLAEKACRHLHLERFREENHYAPSPR